MTGQKPLTPYVEATGTDQLAIWDRTLWQAMGGLRSSVIGDSPFFGRARFQTAGDVKICELSSSPVSVIREKTNARHDDRGFIKIAVQLSGRSLFSQSNREVMLDGAGWTFYDTAQPYKVTNLSTVHQFVLLVPKKLIHASPQRLEHYSIYKFGEHPGVSKIFSSYINTILTNGQTATQDELSALGDVAANLLNLSIANAAQGTDYISTQETLQFQIKHFIHKNISDPELSVQQIAQYFGYSKRHIHRAFNASDLSLGDYILRSRLEKCAGALRNKIYNARSVGELAFQYGFNNLSHFSRSFRQYFGVSPSFYRRMNH